MLLLMCFIYTHIYIICLIPIYKSVCINWINEYFLIGCDSIIKHFYLETNMQILVIEDMFHHSWWTQYLLSLTWSSFFWLVGPSQSQIHCGKLHRSPERSLGFGRDKLCHWSLAHAHLFPFRTSEVLLCSTHWLSDYPLYGWSVSSLKSAAALTWQKRKQVLQ